MKRLIFRTAVGALLVAVAFAPAEAQERYGLPPEPAFGEPEAEQDPVPVGGALRITGCNIDLVDEIEVPATEAGVLVYLGVKEGDAVRAERVIAQIDDLQARQSLRIAELAVESALARAEDDIEIRYSDAAAKVARVDWEEMLQANASVRKAVTEAEIRRAKLDYDRSNLGTEKARKEKELNGLEAHTKRAELEATKINIDRRRILAPFDGQVLEVFRHQNEWVQPGEPIVRLARLDKLQVDGWVYYKDNSPVEVDGCEVTIEVSVGHGRTTQATGRIVYVSPIAEGLGEHLKYRVRAEIANRREQNHWIISPGLNAEMSIHLGTGGEKVTNAELGLRNSE